MSAHWTSTYLNRDIYPIDDLNHPKTRQLIAEGQASLQKIGAAEFPDFINAAGVAKLVEEGSILEKEAYWNDLVANAYLDEPDPSLPEDHPRKLKEFTSLGAVGYDQFPSGNLLRQIYEWDPLMSFVGAVIGLEKIFRYGDPMGALNLSVMKDGDYLRWHFDQTDFVTSLSIRNANVGGDFEYVPMIRTASSENFDDVRALLKGARERVATIANKPGTLLLFKGRYSIHRVTPIKGPVSRLMGLFGYDAKPGVMSSAYLRKIRYGRSEPVKKS